MDLFNRSPEKKLKKYVKKNVPDTSTLENIKKMIDNGSITTQEEVDEKIEKARTHIESSFAINKTINKVVVRPLTITGKPEEGYLYFKFEESELYLIEANGEKVRKIKTPLKL